MSLILVQLFVLVRRLVHYILYISRVITIFMANIWTMNPRQEILQVLFESCVFDGNLSRLARTLGYESDSRSTIGRVKSGERELTDRTLDTLYSKIKDEYMIGDADIETIARSVAYGKSLYAGMRDVYGTGDEWHNLLFGIFVTESYSVRPEIGEELVNELKEMKLQETEVYYGMLAYFFILCKGISPYTKKGQKALPAQLNELNDFLYELYPSNNRSYEAGKESINILLAAEGLSILKLIYTFGHIIRGYVDKDYFEIFLREKGHLLNVGEESFWTVPGETFHEGSELWYFVVIPTKSAHRGVYMVMRLRAKSPATDSFELVGAYDVMFIIDENCDDIHVFRANETSTGKVEYALFSYDEEKRLLELDFDEMPERTLNLPSVLKCLNHTSPKGKNETVWSRIIERLLGEKCFKFILAAANSSMNSNIEYLAEYDVTNVCIDRKNVIVTFEKEIGCEYDEEDRRENAVVEQKSYTIPVDSYSFLEELTPSEFASVVRYKDSGELAIAWNNLGQNIPLREFKEL